KKSIVFRCTHQGPIGENDQGKESRLGKQEFIDGIIVLSDNIRPPQFDQPVRKGSYPKVVPLVYQQRFYRDPYRLHGVPTPKIGAFEKSCLGIYLEESPVGSHIDLSIAVLLYGLDDQGWERTGFVHLYFFYLEIHRIEPVQALFKTPDIQFSQIVLLNGRDGDRVPFDALVFQGDPFEAVVGPVIKVQSLFRSCPKSVFAIEIGPEHQAAVQGSTVVQNMFIGFKVDPIVAVEARAVGPQPNEAVIVLYDGVDAHPGDPFGNIDKIVFGIGFLAPHSGKEQTNAYKDQKTAYPMGNRFHFNGWFTVNIVNPSRPCRGCPQIHGD